MSSSEPEIDHGIIIDTSAPLKMEHNSENVSLKIINVLISFYTILWLKCTRWSFKEL